MKKIKTLIIYCFIYLFLTGCSAEVVLKIDEESVDELIKISDLKTNVYENGVLNEEVRTNIEDFEMEYEFYDMNEFETGNYVGKTYELKEEILLWSELSHVNPCYENFEITKTDTTISLRTSDEYLCGYLYGATDVTLIIESELELISSNADEVDGNRLIWRIDNDNYKNKSIQFDYRVLNEKEKQAKQQNETILYISIIAIVVVACGLIYILIKNKNSNKL